MVQPRIHDRVDSVRPPVRLPKGFTRVTPGLDVLLTPGVLVFHRRDMRLGNESGDCDVLGGGSAATTQPVRFTLIGTD